MRLIRFIVGGLAGVLAALAGTVWWLFYDHPPATGRFPIHLTALRTEAARLPGPGPSRIEVEIASHTLVPKIAMVAGTEWGDVDLVRASYRLVWAGRSVMIDTANDEALARRFKAASFDRAAYRRIVAGMDAASAIVITHEHADHIGALVTSPHLEQELPKALLTPEQVHAGAWLAALTWPAGAIAGYRPLIYSGIHAIAPGVVLIKAPGHTPGSQMIYVRRADGRELIFMGDSASLADNVALQRGRSRYVASFYGSTHEDRDAVGRQIATLHALRAGYPDLTLVPGHDAAAIARLEQKGSLTRGFSVEP